MKQIRAHTHTRAHTQSQSPPPIFFTINVQLGAGEEEGTRRDRFWETSANTHQLFFSSALRAHQPVLAVTSQDFIASKLAAEMTPMSASGTSKFILLCVFQNKTKNAV